MKRNLELSSHVTLSQEFLNSLVLPSKFLNHLKLPLDLLKHILSYLEPRHIVILQALNKEWKNVLWETIICPLYNNYFLPKAFESSKLWKHLLAYHLKQENAANIKNTSLILQPFSLNEQRNYFYSYSQTILNHPVNMIPSVFIKKIMKRFIQREFSIESEEIVRFRQQLVVAYAPLYQRYLTYLFNHQTLKRLNQLYQLATSTWNIQLAEDVRVVQQLEPAFTDLESFFVACTILDNQKNHIALWDFFQPAYRQGLIQLLKGHDLVLLSQGVLNVPNMIKDMFRHLIHPAPGVTRPNAEQIGKLVTKLTIHNIICFIYSNILNNQVIVSALSIQHPHILSIFLKASDFQLRDLCCSNQEFALAILSQPSLAPLLSEESLIAIFNKFDLNNFLNIFNKDYIIERLVSPKFLKDLENDAYWQEDNEEIENINVNRKLFIEFLLTTPKIVEKLPLDIIETFIVSYKLSAKKELIDALASQEKLQATTFCKLLKGASPYRLKNKNWIFTYAFQLASKIDVIQSLIAKLDNDLTTVYQLLQFALWAPEARSTVCPLLQEPKIIVKLTEEQLQILLQSFKRILGKNKDKIELEPNYQLIHAELKTLSPREQPAQYFNYLASPSIQKKASSFVKEQFHFLFPPTKQQSNPILSPHSPSQTLLPQWRIVPILWNSKEKFEEKYNHLKELSCKELKLYKPESSPVSSLNAGQPSFSADHGKLINSKVRDNLSLQAEEHHSHHNVVMDPLHFLPQNNLASEHSEIFSLEKINSTLAANSICINTHTAEANPFHAPLGHIPVLSASFKPQNSSTTLANNDASFEPEEHTPNSSSTSHSLAKGTPQ